MKRLITKALSLIFLCFPMAGFQQFFCQTAQPTMFAPAVVSTELMETTASFTPDGKTVYFTRSDNRFTDNTIMFSELKNGTWSEPQVASFSGIWRDSEPHVSPDGKKIFFVSNRAATQDGKPLMGELNGRKFPGANVWYVEKTPIAWSEPVRIDAELNNTAEIYNPSVALNGNLYFSARYASTEPMVGYKIYRAVYRDGKYEKPERLSFSDNKLNDMDPAIDPEERFVVFASNRPGAIAISNLFISVKDKDGVWGKPIPLEGIISSFGENAPSLGPDRKTLYFTTGRSSFIDVTFPKKKENFADAMKRIKDANSRSRNIWQVDISSWISAKQQ